MRSYRRRPALLSALACALAVLTAGPTTADPQAGDSSGADGGVGAEVVRLYQEAAIATQRYEAGRQEAEKQRARMRRAEDLLERQRRELAVLHEDLGRIARAQYREAGGLQLAARMILAEDPDEMMRSQHVFSQADLVVSTAIGRSRRAEARLAADEAKAAAAWQALEKGNAELATMKKGIEANLEEARIRLQGRADASVTAGSCSGAIRLDQPPTVFTQEWVAPVETYELSASFGSGGSRWAHRHTGQDFAVPIGTPVRAVGAGRVVRIACGGAFGIQVVVEHAGGYYTQYAHLAAVTVDQGERVTTGRWIGQSGNTGNSTGPHLHFEVRITPEMGSALDPAPWLAARGVPLG